MIEVFEVLDGITATGNFFCVRGKLRNTGDVEIGPIKVKLKIFDQQGKLLAMETRTTDPYVLSPDSVAQFSFLYTADPRQDHYSIIPQYE
jgi:hypothetical protein